MSIHLAGLSLLVSALVRWPCNISIHVSPRPVTFVCLPDLSLALSALFRWPCSISILCLPGLSHGVSLSIGHEAFLSFVSQVRYCWRPPFSVGHALLFIICLPGLSLAVSALFRWRCNISIHWFVTAGVRPFPLAFLLAMQHFYSFVPRVCHWCCRSFPLAK